MDLSRFRLKQLSSRISVWAVVGCLSVAAGFFIFGPAFLLILVPLSVGICLMYRFIAAHLATTTRQMAETNRLHLATIEALATAIDARDQIGSGHVRRTQIYALNLGEALGLSEPEMDALRTGALLHDIGKLAVPDHILSKAGQLTLAEMEKAKTHAAVGAAILNDIDFPYPVVPTIRSHHECWDGSGYPQGLAGTEIPVTARILAVADAYDVLRSDRPFREAMTREEARRHLANRGGLQFDPHIVQIFLKNLAASEAKVEAAGFGYGDGVDPQHVSEGGFVEQIKAANREVFTLFELTREFGESDNLRDMLSTLTRKVGEFVPFDTCSIFLLDETRSIAQAVHVEGKNKALLASKMVRLGEGATGFVLKRREPVINVNPDLDFSVSQLEMIQEYETMASFPLIADEGLIGAVSVYSSELASYGEEHIRILETITRIAAGAIAKLQDHVQTKAHALTDPMTGLPNARSLQMQYERELSRADRLGSRFQVLMMDLDGFKAVNDNYGHKIGDKLLGEIGKVIQAQLREYDFLGRYGGDEFIAIIPSANRDDVADLCSRIERAVGAFRLHIDGDKYATVGVSLGSATYPGEGKTFDQMIVAADKAMYKSKSGRKKSLLVANNPDPTLDELLSRAVGSEFVPERIGSGGFVVELDESAVVSHAVN